MNRIGKLMKLSIRARVAWSILCLEQKLGQDRKNDKSWEEILELLWTYTSSNRLDIWDNKTAKIDPEVILFKHPDINAPQTALQKKLILVYQRVDEGTLTILNAIINIGTYYLYGAISEGDDEECVLQLSRIEEVCVNDNITWPPDDLFAGHTYSPKKPYGELFERGKY